MELEEEAVERMQNSNGTLTTQSPFNTNQQP
jgi:hypothetical protein